MCFFLQKIHKICTGQNKIVSLEKISSQRFNYERMDLDYEGINRNVFPFFQEAETSVSFFCLILFLLSKETGEQGMFIKGERFRIIQSEIEGEQRLQFFLIFVYPAKKSMTAFLKMSLVR